MPESGRTEARVHILVSGHVQGVFFRKSVMDLAKYLGVAGWVRNLRDGGVEVLAEGPKARLDDLVEFCREGPPGAKVSNVTVDWTGFRHEFLGFRIIH